MAEELRKELTPELVEDRDEPDEGLTELFLEELADERLDEVEDTREDEWLEVLTQMRHGELGRFIHVLPAPAHSRFPKD